MLCNKIRTIKQYISSPFETTVPSSFAWCKYEYTIGILLGNHGFNIEFTIMSSATVGTIVIAKQYK